MPRALAPGRRGGRCEGLRADGRLAVWSHPAVGGGTVAVVAVSGVDAQARAGAMCRAMASASGTGTAVAILRPNAIFDPRQR